MSSLSAFFLLALCGTIGYSLFSALLVLRFKQKHRSEHEWNKAISISVLRPLRGGNEESYSILASLYQQTSLPSQVYYGVDEANDPILSVVNRLERDFPETPTKVFIGEKSVGSNRKIAKLSVMSEGCTTTLVAAIDQDIVMPQNHLRKVINPFLDPNVGLVTSLYRLGEPNTIGSALELLSVHADFVPSVLIAEQLEGGLHFAFGATLVFRREVLETIGGFKKVRDCLADDHDLGLLVSQAGYRVVLSDSIVEHHPGKLDFKGYWVREIRAARTHRICRPFGYALSLLTHGVPWILGLILVSGFTPLVEGVVLVWGASRLAAVILSHRLLTEKKGAWWPLLLLPLHEVMRWVFWIVAFLGNKISWGGVAYQVRSDGTMKPEEDLTGPRSG